MWKKWYGHNSVIDGYLNKVEVGADYAPGYGYDIHFC